MFPVTFVFIVDNPKRDLSGLVLVAANLASQGFRTAFVPFNLQLYELPQLGPRAVVLNYLRDNNASAAIEYHRIGSKVFVLDTEGGVFGSEDAFEKTCITKDKKAIEAVCKYLCWGEGARLWLLKYKAASDDQVVVTGAPRFDLYKKARKPRSVSTRPKLLINCNFSLSNPKFRSLNDEIDFYTDILHASREHVEFIVTEEIAKRRDFIKIAFEIAHHHPDISVQLRPHPFERIETYFEEIPRPPKNLEISDSRSIVEDITNSFAVIQRGCTTAIESHILGVPTISPLWSPEVWPVELADTVSTGVNSFEELNQLVQILKSRPIVEERGQINSHVKFWLGPLDGLAYKRVSEELTACLTDSNNQRRKSRFYFFARELYRLRRLRSTRLVYSQWRSTAKFFDHTDVINCFEKLKSDFFDNKIDVNIRQAQASDYPGGSLIDRAAVVVEPKLET